MRARMAIAISGVQVEYREVALKQKPAEMLAASPKGTVPVLVLTDDQVIDESLDIMHWALVQNDPEDWLDGNDPDLIAVNDGPFKAALDRYKYPHRFDLTNGLAHRDVGLEMLLVLNNRLETAPFLMGHKCGLTDIALFPFVRQFAATDKAWFDAQPITNLQYWLNALTAGELFHDIMKKSSQWHPDSKGIPIK